MIYLNYLTEGQLKELSRILSQETKTKTLIKRHRQKYDDIEERTIIEIYGNDKYLGCASERDMNGYIKTFETKFEDNVDKKLAKKLDCSIFGFMLKTFGEEFEHDYQVDVDARTADLVEQVFNTKLNKEISDEIKSEKEFDKLNKDISKAMNDNYDEKLNEILEKLEKKLQNELKEEEKEFTL